MTTLDPNIPQVNEEKIERALRPQTFDDYIGQADLVKKIKICIEASKIRNDPIDHILLCGPPGLGKTTIANIIAKEAACRARIVTAPSIASVADLVELLSKLQNRDILFIDEIHALPLKIGEMLYPAMEDFKIDIKLGNKEIVSLKVNPFCLIGATTAPGKIPAPLRDRFGISYTMQFYSTSELGQIINANASKLKLKLTDESVLDNIATRSRGIPRIANRLLRRIRDFAQVENAEYITNEIVDASLELEGIDPNGISMMDKKYLTSIYKVYNCGPVGVHAIAATIGEDRSTVEDYIEPFLVRQGLIARTKQGRLLTGKGMKYVLNTSN